MKTIIKRNGEAAPFDESKIFNAIYAANKAVKDEPMTSIDFEYLTKKVLQQLDAEQCTVEQVQDIVESMLIKYDYEKTAKAYILYRAEHAKIRDAESDLMNIYNELTYSDSKDADIKRENANRRSLSASALTSPSICGPRWERCSNTVPKARNITLTIMFFPKKWQRRISAEIYTFTTKTSTC